MEIVTFEKLRKLINSAYWKDSNEEETYMYGLMGKDLNELLGNLNQKNVEEGKFKSGGNYTFSTTSDNSKLGYTNALIYTCKGNKNIGLNNIIIVSRSTGNKEIICLTVNNNNYETDRMKHDDTTYVIYDSDGIIETKLKIKECSIDNINMYDVYVLNKFTHMDKEYTKLSFRIVEENNEIILYSNKDRIILKGNGFDPANDLAINYLNNISNTIQNRLTELITNEKTKIYVPKNKQGR